MLRDVVEPRDAGGFAGDIGLEAAGDGAVDDGLLLLVQLLVSASTSQAAGV